MHWWLANKLRQLHEANLYHPLTSWVYLLFDFMSLMTLPLGPEEHRDVFYANSRLGVTVWSAHSWDQNQKGGQWWTFVSRVVERGSLFAIAL